MASWASPIGCGLATTTGRIEFVILRTDGSLPVALHLLSRERSYLQLMSPDQTHGTTFTLPIKHPHRRTPLWLHARGASGSTYFRWHRKHSLRVPGGGRHPAGRRLERDKGSVMKRIVVRSRLN